MRLFCVHILESLFLWWFEIAGVYIGSRQRVAREMERYHGWPYVRGPNSCSHAGYSEQLTNSTSECSRTRWATSRAFDVNLTTCDTSHPLAIPILFLFVVLIQHTDPFFIVRLVLLSRCQYEEYAPSLFLSSVRLRLLTLVFHRSRRPTTILPCHFLNPSFLWSRTIHRHHPSTSTS